MCSDTKSKIANAVLELMQKRAVSKITVQDVMERTNMTRQSFYYHFQDIYAVLEWDINHNVKQHLTYQANQSFDDWCATMLTLLSQNQGYCRKAIDALGRDKLIQILEPVVVPQMERLLHDSGRDENCEAEDLAYALHFCSKMFVQNMMDLVTDKPRINVVENLGKIRAVVHVLRGKQVGSAVAPTAGTPLVRVRSAMVC